MRPGRVTALLLLGVMLCFAGPLRAEQFPKPLELKANVEFWKRVYTEITTQQGFLHDDRQLDIVYETITLPGKVSRKHRKRLVKKHREKIRQLLLKIANKPESSLSDDELRIRRLFPAGTSAQQIRAATRHIRFQLGQADKFRKAVERAGIIQPYIRQKLIEAGLPTELAALPYVESSFNLNARSHVGAAGMWQFMPATGRRFMKVNHIIDERIDPYRATEAAVRLLQYNYSILKTWPLALTAYNHGVAGMRRAVKRMGTTDIGHIASKYRSRSFRFASRNFYAEFLAALEISQDPQRHFPGVKPGRPLDYVTFSLPDYIPADQLASALGVSSKTLRQHNPGLLRPIWDGDKHIPKGYELRLPRQALSSPPGQLIASIPSADRYATQVPDTTYKVRRGDSLSRIAALYGTRVKDLMRMNNLSSAHRIRAGQTLYLPQKGKPVVPPTALDKQPVVVAAAGPMMSNVPDSQPDKPATPAKMAAEPVVVDAAVEAPAGIAGTADQESVKASEQIARVETPAEEDVAGASEDVVDEADEPAVQAPTPNVTTGQISATDPADYSVAADESIEIQAEETLGHYADWLGLPTKRLRKLNGLSRWRPVVIGQRIRLDFSRVSSESFLQKRKAYHDDIEDAFFANHSITGTRPYRIRRGDSLWILANKRLSVPLWLLRQYNPDVDFGKLRPGDELTVPVVIVKPSS